MDHFKIRPLAESDIDAVIAMAGGRRAHPDADRRALRGADYVLDDCVIELKMLDDDGLAKPERQKKLAALFRHAFPDKPVVVMDREALEDAQQRNFDRVVEGPIKTAVASARGQLKQSRLEHPEAASSILWVVNNGYTALDHDALLRIVAHRVSNDSREIDAVVVSGCYFYSDTFDSYFLWPIDFQGILGECCVEVFDRIKAAWDATALGYMNAFMRGDRSLQDTKGPVVDGQFDVDGVTFVKPAPPMGKASAFFPDGRPRSNSSGIDGCPQVATVFAQLTAAEWQHFRSAAPDAPWVGDNYEEWLHWRPAVNEDLVLRPLVGMEVSFEAWQAWLVQEQGDVHGSLNVFATGVFNERARALVREASELDSGGTIPCPIVLAVTHEIGQDMANDLSHLLVISRGDSGKLEIEEICVNQRIFHLHALGLACAHAVARGIGSVMWQVDLSYAWR